MLFRSALRNNLGILMSDVAVEQAVGDRRVATSDLLPHLFARVADTRQMTNLEAFGLPVARTGLPSVVGPFSIFDARVHLLQTVFDRSALNDRRAEQHNERAARFANRSRRDLVALLAADLYLQALAADARVGSAKAATATARALYDQALDLKSSGIIADIDVLRAQARLSGESTRLTNAEHESEKAKLQLARMIGLPLGQTFTISEAFPDVAVPEISFEQALERAYQERPDYKSARERILAAESRRAAVAGELMPAVHASADYGKIGLSPSSAIATYTVVGSVTVPIFEGGRTQAKLVDADADLRLRRGEADNIKADIYYDVRNAFLDMEATEQALRSATETRELATRALTQAQDRFQAGVANNLEVIQAQEAVATASEQFIDARYGFLIAKAMLAGSVGGAEVELKRYLGGTNR